MSEDVFLAKQDVPKDVNQDKHSPRCAAPKSAPDANSVQLECAEREPDNHKATAEEDTSEGAREDARTQFARACVSPEDVQRVTSCKACVRL